jgi:hypothetical protein
VPKDMKFKCRTIIDEYAVEECEKLLEDDNNESKDATIREFLKKNFFKFYINIYKNQSINTPTNDLYLLDIHLFKGTQCIFLDFVKNFINTLKMNCTCVSSCPSLQESPYLKGQYLDNYKFSITTSSGCLKEMKPLSMPKYG